MKKFQTLQQMKKKIFPLNFATTLTNLLLFSKKDSSCSMRGHQKVYKFCHNIFLHKQYHLVIAISSTSMVSKAKTQFRLQIHSKCFQVLMTPKTPIVTERTMTYHIGKRSRHLLSCLICKFANYNRLFACI